MLDCDKVKRLRDKELLTLEEAAKRAGFNSKQQWHAIESGLRADIRLSTLDQVAKALRVRAQELLK